MAIYRILLVLLCCYGAIPSLAQAPTPVAPGAIWVLDLDGAVGPATSDYLLRGMEKAAQADAALIVIRMNTPGGLDGAMRDIIQGILASPVPVATYVSPQGARAASAGTYILYASHIAAMAPATNLGAATPVSIGGPSPVTEPAPEEDSETESAGKGSTAMERKMINDAAAYIRGLAELRGRNSEWAESAVRDAESLSAQEALEQNVIDLVAANLDEMLQLLEGRSIAMDGDEFVLELADAPIHEAAPDWRTEFLAIITNPNLVLILGMIGFYGIILEFYNPGSLVPGTIGVICLLLAGYALQLLPVNYAGLALLVFGIGLMVAEAMAPSFGILGFGGIVAFVMGGIILFDTDVEAFQVAWPLLLVFAIVTAAFIMVTISIALRMRRQQVTTGIEKMLGLRGEALAEINTEGMVRVGAEIWQARSGQPIEKGSRVIVTDVSGLLLHVKKEID
ncbi:MAG: nodulation protein NfeD [Gammaproteobacteria bacterium]|nr:nodulation protein NfeD [Gammaproteobacteria bacterium]